MNTDGGCFCGKIRYQITGPVPRVVNCHCTMCRRTSGAPFVTWLVIPAAGFRYLRGKPALLKSSDKGSRYFCPSCGTPIACINLDHADYVDVTLGSLDHPDAFKPDSEFFEDTKLGWLGQERG